MVGHFDAGKAFGICRGTGNPADGVFDVVAGDDGLDAGQILSRGCVDGVDARMGIRASQNCHMQGIGQFNVIDVVREALDQSGVFAGA